MNFAALSVSVRRNLRFLTAGQRRALTMTEAERQAREGAALAAQRLGVRMPSELFLADPSCPTHGTALPCVLCICAARSTS